MNDMDYGERKKIGLIYPSAGWVMEQELNEMTPDGYQVDENGAWIRETP